MPVVLLLPVALFLWSQRGADPPPASGEVAGPSSDPAPRAEEADGLTVLRGTAFDQAYLDPAHDARRDLELVRGIWLDAMLLVKDHDRFPLAENRDFTAFLQGGNPHRVAWIRPGHPAVNPSGELVDRWGTALFFHRESSRSTGLRSAGPDRELWTEDDVALEGNGTAVAGEE